MIALALLAATTGLSAPWPLLLSLGLLGLGMTPRLAAGSGSGQAEEVHLATIYRRSGRLVLRRMKEKA